MQQVSRPVIAVQMHFPVKHRNLRMYKPGFNKDFVL